MPISAIDYDNSILLDSNICIDNADFEKVFLQLYSELRSTGTFARWHLRHSDTLKLIITNLYHCYCVGPDMAVAYSRTKNWYAQSQRYNATKLHYETTVRIVDALIKLKFVESKKGCYYKNQNWGRTSRIRATDKLIELLNETGELESIDVRRSSVEETIILKDKDKQKIDYEDSDETIRMRSNAERINRTIEGSFIGLCVYKEAMKQLKQELIGREGEEDDLFRTVIDFSKTKLRRIFNNGSFKEGGRFYNGWWQAIPSRFRKNIRIDNIGTVEIDFSGLHINLLYAEEGLPLPKDDVYNLPGIPTEARNMLKIALQVMLNSSNENKALFRIKKEFPFSSNPKLFSNFSHKKIIEAFKEKHKGISKYFYLGYGVKLQYLDSQIAEDVMLMLADNGIVSLPVHDSFLVQRTHKDDLIRVMTEVVNRRYQQNFKHKSDSTAFEKESQFFIDEIIDEDIPRSVEEYEDMWSNPATHPEYFARLKAWKKKSN